MLTFETCVEGCLGNPDFVKEFNRLTDSTVGEAEARTAIETLVDRATGYEELKETQSYKKFVAFVYETIWLRLPDEAKDPTQMVQPPPGQSIEELLGISL